MLGDPPKAEPSYEAVEILLDHGGETNDPDVVRICIPVRACVRIFGHRHTTWLSTYNLLLTLTLELGKDVMNIHKDYLLFMKYTFGRERKRA